MTKREMMDRVDAGWARFHECLDSIDAGLLEVEAEDGWSVKDHVSHVAAWELNLQALLESRDRRAAMGVPSLPAGADFDEINAAVRLLHHDESFPKTRAFSQATHRGLRERLDSMTIEELELPYSHYQPLAPLGGHSSQIVGAWVAGITFEHYDEHIPWIRSLAESVRSTARTS